MHRYLRFSEWFLRNATRFVALLVVAAGVFRGAEDFAADFGGLYLK
jgi:hypothetical protein